MSRSGTDFPRAFLPARVFVWPVGTGDEAIWTVDLLFTLGCANNDNINQCGNAAQNRASKKAADLPTILLKGPPEH